VLFCVICVICGPDDLVGVIGGRSSVF